MRRQSLTKLGFRNEKPAKKMEAARNILSGVGKFPEAHQQKVGLSALAEKYKEAEAAAAEIGHFRGLLRAARSRHKRALKELEQTAWGVMTSHVAEVKHDPAQVQAGGIALRRVQKPVGQPAAPTYLRVAPGSHIGTVMLRWKRPLRRCVFLIEVTTDPNGQTGWTRLKECSPQKCLLKGLTSGQVYWFRVAALNAHGTGPWGGPVMFRVG